MQHKSFAILIVYDNNCVSGLDGPDILKKSNEMPYANGDVAGAVANSAGLQPFQIEFIKNMIDDSMDEFRWARQ